MPTFRVRMQYERVITFYVEAESEADVDDFLGENDTWQPGDVPGLIDIVGDEVETGVAVDEADYVTANFRVTPELELEELDS